MTAALVGLSHSPLIGKNDPPAHVLEACEGAVATARTFVEDFDPELVVLYAPDHYNGFFYGGMPPFCLATGAISVGDFGSTPGPLSVDTEAARHLAKGTLDRGIDLTVSAQMTVDHGMVQPLEQLFGGITDVPVVPVFVNGVATPLGPVSRIRALGEALGSAAAELDRRVLFIGSGGLSHDPPVPVLEGAPPPVAKALIEGLSPTPDQRAKGESRVVAAGRAFAADELPSMKALNPEWDNLVLDTLTSGDLSAVDDWTVEWMAEEGGGSAHEVRSWVAAFASLSTFGGFDVSHRFYRAVPEWIAGYAVVTATSTT
ncbi:3-carboxyethylcatechol 2,3-dioxygenase [Janibacter sp. YIM B02568]|uniref:3-carboxyethylcatechol 2,3-dioxygenase n=1 Tax=Janibacter endophyticus TaxID=2806261 RepID=UPI00194F4481|nr:3-carboxyethylcatechol 2,3-dioxygenase [Janibacter endophyticus]MBM6545362.1 3-carboxyethylcatechol 2,3-dioxygenase [Janibacter endophyticus]